MKWMKHESAGLMMLLAKLGVRLPEGTCVHANDGHIYVYGKNKFHRLE